MFQLYGNITLLPSGKLNLHTTTLPCLCPPYKTDPANLDTCLYKAHCNIKTIIVSQSGVCTEEEKVLYGLAKRTIIALTKELDTRGLCKSGNKPELCAKLGESLDREMVGREGMINKAAASFRIE